MLENAMMLLKYETKPPVGGGVLMNESLIKPFVQAANSFNK